MKGSIIFRLIILIIVTLLFSACNLPANITPTPFEQYSAYTEAAETIAAQLTIIANPILGTPSPAGSKTTSPSVPGTLTETLPATSTPLPSDTPTSTDTSVPTETPETTPTRAVTSSSTPIKPAEDPKSQLGAPTWKDEFNTSTNWPLYEDEHVEMEIKEGQLIMTALNADKWDSWMITTPIVTDFYLEVIATPGECKGLDRYGLVARTTDNASQAYVFGFSCDGKYSLRIWNGEKYIMLVEWIPSPLINPNADQTNRLGLMAKGDKISLYANGNLLTELTDDTFSEGGFGLFIGAVSTPGFTVLFDEIAYWDLSE